MPPQDPLTSDEIKHVARLARLGLSEEEVEAMRHQLGRILEYVAALDRVDVEGVSPTSHVFDLGATLREDSVGGHLDRQLALSQAPSATEDAFAVPKVMETDP
ncbi:MAG: Asp-tRNA(Asn)/Glu-tRNA(Gln) amidotransferase subunit GatC [Myxococcales bacterium]|nr:Asp-tRNA(Asn)/Glu-tRNA(Gln) amidotransferase subunit GatC [Myxococcales bacterium]